MKVVVIGEGSGATIETIMSVYPRHKVLQTNSLKEAMLLEWAPLLTEAEIWQYSKTAQPLSNLQPKILLYLKGLSNHLSFVSGMII